MGHAPTTKDNPFNLPTSIPIPSFAKAPSTVDAPATAGNWLSRFGTALASNDPSALRLLFAKESWWRDALALSWDLRTLKGIEKIEGFLSDGGKLANAEFANLKLKEQGPFTPPHEISLGEGIDFVEAVFTFETRVGRGDGIFRLVYDDNVDPNAGEESKWKAYMVYTAVQELKDYQWAEGASRPRGGNNTLQGAGNWLEARQKEKNFLVGRQPVCLVIGAGQAGLTIAARLKALGVESLVIDRNKRIGDNWRLRYRTLSTHDPVYYCHMAYLPFPPTWPFFTAKDKLAGWFESYASIMELNVWTSTTISYSSWDEGKHTWTITVNRNDEGKNEQRTFHPHHVILCTGHSGEPKIPSFPGQDKFKGTVYHGSQHEDASLLPYSVAGKKVLIVGTGNSGHDIAQNFTLSGASVTMLQRSSTLVVCASKGLITMTEAMYGPHAPPVEDADLFVQSFPWPVFFAVKRLETLAIQEQEKEELEGLEKAGRAKF